MQRSNDQYIDPKVALEAIQRFVDSKNDPTNKTHTNPANWAVIRKDESYNSQRAIEDLKKHKNIVIYRLSKNFRDCIIVSRNVEMNNGSIDIEHQTWKAKKIGETFLFTCFDQDKKPIPEYTNKSM